FRPERILPGVEAENDLTTLDHNRPRVVVDVGLDLLKQAENRVGGHDEIVAVVEDVDNQPLRVTALLFPIWISQGSPARETDTTRVCVVYLRVLSTFFLSENSAQPRYTPRMLRRIVPFLLLMSGLVFAQNSSIAKQSALTAQDKEFVSLQFGSEFVLLDKFPVLTADFDGDGAEDAVFVATRKNNPLVDEEKFHYKVVDPYDEYFGWGDPQVTSKFETPDADEVKYILIAHDWRAAAPKAKLVVLNLPFENLAVDRIPGKKKKIYTAIIAQDRTGETSAIYWDVKKKKYKWNSMSGID
ncbi:MAG: hypothetical protein ACM3JB_21960, partial [Acidobacteriaceae bacterium]